jgi:hypothetical protein
MLSQRTTHYWLWFLLFGVVAGLAYMVGKANLAGIPKSEPIWLFVTGLLGIVAGAGKLTSRFTRPYDLVVGLIFTAIGLLGLLHNFGINLTGSSAISSDAILGLSLSLPFALIHTVLGLTSLNQSFKVTPLGSPVVVNSPSREAA